MPSSSALAGLPCPVIAVYALPGRAAAVPRPPGCGLASACGGHGAAAADRDILHRRRRDRLGSPASPPISAAPSASSSAHRLGRVQVALAADRRGHDGDGGRDGREVNARCRPLANGCSISLGKNDRPVMYAAWLGWQVLQRTGRAEQLLDRVVAEEGGEQAADRRLVGHQVRGWRGHARGDQPAGTGATGRSAARPRVTMVKNRPMDSTVAEFWNVFSMPAPAPRWSAAGCS